MSKPSYKTFCKSMNAKTAIPLDYVGLLEQLRKAKYLRLADPV
jgi:hypothetical protein